MRIAYFTLDDVNRDLVRRWAARAGALVSCSAGSPPAGGLDRQLAVILDLDFLPPEVRASWIHRAVAGGVPCPVLAHGHNVTDGDARAMVRRGVHVCRGRLRRAALCGWLRSVARVLAGEAGVWSAPQKTPSRKLTARPGCGQFPDGMDDRMSD